MERPMMPPPAIIILRPLKGSPSVDSKRINYRLRRMTNQGIKKAFLPEGRRL
jgi:hypothetical protein